MTGMTEHATGVLLRMANGSIDKRDARIAELEAALSTTHRLIVEAAMTGFNCHDGDWAERLFVNQGSINDALRG